MVEIRRYQDNQVSAVGLDELLRSRSDELSSDTVVWVDLASPTRDEESAILGTWYPIHELAREDMQHATSPTQDDALHHPKIEDFGTYLFIIVHATIPPKEKARNILSYLHMMGESQLNIIVGEQVLITHHNGESAVTDRLRAICARNPHAMRRGPDYLLHLILDDIVDEYLPLVHMIDDRIEELERQVFGTLSSDAVLMRILTVKRELQKVRRGLAYQREIVNRLSRGEFALVSTEESFYYRNVYDHLVRLTDQIDEGRDLAMNIMEAYFSVSSARLNQVMKVLTVFSTVFLPITFITSLYGMNFEFMPELHQTWGYPAVLTTIVVTVIAMILFFKRRGWLG
jgi:magnesium transporter